MTLQYAKDRHQFGVPIGSFQAVQHKLADMSLDVERAWSAVYFAAMTIDADDADRHRAVHVAKAAAGEAAKRAAKDGIQIHGGIGYTWEHDLHLFMRRAFALRSAPRHHRLAPRPPRRPPDRLTARSSRRPTAGRRPPSPDGRGGR